MSYLDNSKITSTEVATNHVQAAADRLTGTTTENKKVFDNLGQLVVDKFNAALDVVGDKDTTQDTRLTTIETSMAGFTDEVNTAAANANAATTAANNAATAANTAKADADTAATAANTATANANTATSAANTATSNAVTATNNAVTATNNATSAANSANTAATAANAATDAANTATTNANNAATNATAATSAANTAPKYVWIKYSTDSAGSSFHTPSTPADKYVGVAVTANNTEPTLATDYVWSQFRGEDGKGSGDMLTSVYDTNKDGIVNKATADKDGNELSTTYAKSATVTSDIATAKTAAISEAKTYTDTGLSGKADSSHTHTKSQITDLVLATVAATGLYSDLSGSPTVLSSFTNDENFKGITCVSVSIPVASWSSNAATVSVSGVTASNIVVIAPNATTSTNYTNFTGAGIYCSAQAADSLTFTCTTTPTAAITILAMIIG